VIACLLGDDNRRVTGRRIKVSGNQTI